MRRIVYSLLLGLLFALVVAPAQSSEVIYQLDGIVTGPDNVYPTVQTGDTIRIRLVLEDGLPDAHPNNPNVGFYLGSAISTSIMAGSFKAASIGGPYSLTVINGSGGRPEDTVVTALNLAGDFLRSPVTNVTFVFNDASGNRVMDDSFPDLTDFSASEASGIIRFFAAPRIDFSLDSITIIPEPSTALLMALGLAGLALRRN